MAAELNQSFGDTAIPTESLINDGYGDDRVVTTAAHELTDVNQGFGDTVRYLGSTMAEAAKGISQNSRQLEATHPSGDYYDF